MCVWLEKELATHSSVLAWRIPGTGDPGGLPSMGSHRVGHDWSDLAAAAVCVCTHTLSHVQLFVISWTVAHRAPLSLGFSRQEYWSGLPFPSPRDLPDPGIEPLSLVSFRFFTTVPLRKFSTVFRGRSTLICNKHPYTSQSQALLSRSQHLVVKHMCGRLHSF